eukprot:TRINITY_DN22710_c0_g2_i1.p1 TRINITY_DN22710_c0_g2~~TRINITY_DN22710_c0_g2_i1.p1  ORF type:complete len:244 (+),score=49.09 TRINITY_DN22710_c0_g2_i1:106-837(+)
MGRSRSGTSIPPQLEKRCSTTGKCALCFDRKVLYKPTLQCSHEPNACRECLQEYINSKVSDGGSGIVQWDVPAIPCITCKAMMDPTADVAAFASSEDAQRLDRILLMALLRKMPDFVWCMGSECGCGQIHSGGTDNPIVKCHQCDSRACFECGVRWHAGKTCAAFKEAMKQDNKLTDVFLERETKKCPKCLTHIQKRSGCDHMTCVKCRYEFCWRCTADYTMIRRNGNKHHKPTCAYHTRNLS